MQRRLGDPRSLPTISPSNPAHARAVWARRQGASTSPDSCGTRCPGRIDRAWESRRRRQARRHYRPPTIRPPDRDRVERDRAFFRAGCGLAPNLLKLHPQVLLGQRRPCIDFKSYPTGDETSDAAPSSTQRYVCPRDSCSCMDFDGGDAVVARADPGRHDFLTAGRRGSVPRGNRTYAEGQLAPREGRLAGFCPEGEAATGMDRMVNPER